MREESDRVGFDPREEVRGHRLEAHRSEGGGGRGVVVRRGVHVRVLTEQGLELVRLVRLEPHEGAVGQELVEAL